MASLPEPPSVQGRSPRWSDYATLTKPGITALIVLVAVGGFFLSDPTRFDPVRFLLLLATGASASAGAAMLNHYLDRDLDALMKRTRHRPLPEARIAPTSSAAFLGLLLLGAGVGFASVLLNPLTGFSIFLGGLTYVVVYTAWLKRRTSWNIVIGGFAGSAPALAGSAAATGTWTDGAIALAVLVFLWTPPHFWSLALMLREDYRSVGLPMLPKMDDPAYSARVVVVSAALLLPGDRPPGRGGTDRLARGHRPPRRGRWVHRRHRPLVVELRTALRAPGIPLFRPVPPRGLVGAGRQLGPPADRSPGPGMIFWR